MFSFLIFSPLLDDPPKIRIFLLLSFLFVLPDEAAFTAGVVGVVGCGYIVGCRMSLQFSSVCNQTCTWQFTALSTTRHPNTPFTQEGAVVVAVEVEVAVVEVTTNYLLFALVVAIDAVLVFLDQPDLPHLASASHLCQGHPTKTTLRYSYMPCCPMHLLLSPRGTILTSPCLRIPVSCFFSGILGAIL